MYTVQVLKAMFANIRKQQNVFDSIHFEKEVKAILAGFDNIQTNLN